MKTNKLTKDKYYLALDIGGGSTDVSFFKVEADNTFTYLASRSAMVASNDIGMRIYGNEMRLSELALSDEITTRLNEDFYTKDDRNAPAGLFDVSKARWV